MEVLRVFTMYDEYDAEKGALHEDICGNLLIYEGFVSIYESYSKIYDMDRNQLQ